MASICTDRVDPKWKFIDNIVDEVDRIRLRMVPVDF